MNPSDARQLVENLRDREYRETYAEGFLHSSIAHQLTLVRLQRGLTQKVLAERVGTTQSGIARMERNDYGRWSLATLQRVAFALDCRIRVSLETFGSMVKEVFAFTPENLERAAFAEDEVFTGIPSAGSFGTGPVSELRRKFIPWLTNNGPSSQLARWLQGYDLPAVGDEVTPAQWLLDALPPDRDDLRATFAERVSRILLVDRWDMTPPDSRQVDLVTNLLRLVAGLRRPQELGDAMAHVFARKHLVVLEGSNAPTPRHPLADAILYNQPDERFSELWTGHFLKEWPIDLMPDYASYGMLGMSYMGFSPNLKGIIHAVTPAITWKLDAHAIIEILRTAFSRVWDEFPSHPTLAGAVANMVPTTPPDFPWNDLVVKAWTESSTERRQLDDVRGKTLVEHTEAFAANV